MPSVPAPSRDPGVGSDTVVVSCYELGHQPVAVASAVGFLERAGHRVAAVDLAVEPADRLDHVLTPATRLVAVSVPMHTAMQVGTGVARRIREAAPNAHVCFFGLYATLNAEHVLGEAADSVLGGEVEGSLVALADALAGNRPIESVEGIGLPGRPAEPVLTRLPFPVPSRSGLPGVERYARLELGGATRIAAAIESSRGCLHHCRHCPIPPVYGGRFFVVPREIVLEDVRNLVAAGVRHLTFADPDALNGPGHTLAIARAVHEEFPEVTFDLTVKVEHVLAHRDRFPELAACGCIFVVTAVESLSDAVLGHLLKGHTREDVFAALRILREAGIAMRPSFVAFTPWTRLADYTDVLDWVTSEDLLDHVDPVQYSIRLLIPPGSPLAELPATLPHLRGLQPSRLSHAWEHPDPRMDRLHREVDAIVRDGARREEAHRATFERIRDVAFAMSGTAPALAIVPPARATVPPPRLTEPWFC